MATMRFLRLLSLLLLAAAAAAPLHAGQRHTVWAYPPGAGPKGAVEAETWITTGKHDADAPSEAEYRLELENGLSDDVSLDVYLGVFKQTSEEGFKLDRVQTSLRANLFGDKVRDVVDVTGYFEVKRDIELSNPWEFEAILIAGHAYGKLSWNLNLVYESELSSKAFDPDAREVKGILGAGYEVTPRFWAGGELVLANDAGTKEVSVGPTLSLVLTEKTWVAVGPQFGLNDATDDIKVRAIFGIFF